MNTAMPKKVKKSAQKNVKKQSGISILKIVGIILLLGIGGVLAYSTYTFQNSEEEHVGFFVCNKENTVCEQSKHIHADIEMSVCGKDITLPKEKGRTDLQHTHKERNYIHWHARLNVDPQTREPLDPSKLMIAAFLEQMEYTFPSSCPVNPQPVLEVKINDIVTEQGLNYVWDDGDKISILYQ